jgi:hypothetical protein
MAKKTAKRGSGAVAKAWAIFNKHPKSERAEVLVLCDKAGLNPHTSKTQYQRWLHASKSERTEKVNGEKKSNGAAAAAAS